MTFSALIGEETKDLMEEADDLLPKRADVILMAESATLFIRPVGVCHTLRRRNRIQVVLQS